MKSITRRPVTELPERRTFDPFEMMRDMLRWEPFQALERMGGGVFAPDFDVKETKDAFLFKADVPGIKEENLDLSLTGNRLTVSGKREEEKSDEGDRYYTYERSYGSFSRTFTLPEGVDTDHISADLKDGVLTVNLPKTQEVKAKKISLGAGKTAKA